ncbi:Polysaccharide biosynthesis/export protein [Roseivivax sp. THAF40]|uniref:polysaccharide biosynthesis/export family protein n=1 Tax=unclassified Roseivivax TaxID=2639302 RepID=UPI0012A8E47E|nr:MULTISPECIES: polysaccharide biosynthesis/export family protein [unclassified Roseivivax]QFS82438.1 Polysaccharide biosynthesis/export protein [Roseivivax sp. THAF197b]QFT46207.1 Polysaccharide biosynthesis/export protein [Roseivivax sp. THAF40]
MRAACILLTLLASLALPRGADAQAEEYKLNKQDRVLLRVMRWDPLNATHVLWQGVSGEFTLTEGGVLLVPLVGQIEAAGLEVGALADELEQRLQRSAGLSEPPDIAVEVIGHLPVYVLGDVAAPGAYPFRPGLSGEQALALAGGFLRVPTDPLNNAGANMGALRLSGEIRLLDAQLAALDAERARFLSDLEGLEAQGDDADTAPLPDGLQGKILASTRAAREAQGTQIAELETVLRGQVERLGAQIALRTDQIEVVRQELESVSSLKERGLAVNTRVSALTNSLNDLEAKRLQLEIARLTAEQQLNLAERDALTLVGEARSEGLEQLNRIENDIVRLRTQRQTAATLYDEAIAAGLVSESSLDGELVTQFSVTRGTSPTAKEIEPTGALQPGDTLYVRRQRQVAPTTE